jgi:hypothetical protein
MRATASLFALAAFLALSSATLLANAGPLPEPFHNQWQPETENDPRLQQPVHIEIIGRATRTGLPLLSQKTGVSLGVLPQDLDTVGERKFTLIAQGCDLKTIMVQLCEALQECHWDVDDSGPEPVYLLHRNAGADNVKAMEARAKAEERKAVYESATEEIRRALAMSPEQLDELEKTDLFLSRSCRDADARIGLQAFLAMSASDMQTFLDQGRVTVPYATASPQIQAAARIAVRQQAEPMAGGGGITPEDHQEAKANPASWDIIYWAAYNPFDPQDRSTLADVWGYSGQKKVDLAQSLAIPSYGALPPFLLDLRYERLLTNTGMPKEEAAKVLQQMGEETERKFPDSRALIVARSRPEPSDPLLRAPMKLEAKESETLGFDRVQQLVARQTGLSVVSDYSTRATTRSQPLWAQSLQEAPLWRVLDVLCGERSYRWKAAGRCLVFHHELWYQMARFEVPESVLADCREQLREHGKLTLEYLAGLARTLRDEQLSPMWWPADCMIVGLDDAKWALLLYASLTPEQAAKAQSPAGLGFADLTRALQAQVRARADRLGPRPTEEDTSGSTFHVEEQDRPGASGGVELTVSRLWLQFGSRNDEARVLHSYRGLKSSSGGAEGGNASHAPPASPATGSASPTG